MQSMWAEAGCTKEGLGRPVNESSYQAVVLNKLNIRYAAYSSSDGRVVKASWIYLESGQTNDFKIGIHGFPA